MGRFENAWLALIAEAWALGDAAEVERLAASKLIDVARTAAPNDQTRDDIRFCFDREVPTTLGEQGPTRYATRPEVALFGGSGDASDPRKAACYGVLGEMCLVGRHRGLTSVGKFLRPRLERTIRERER